MEKPIEKECSTWAESQKLKEEFRMYDRYRLENGLITAEQIENENTSSRFIREIAEKCIIRHPKKAYVKKPKT